MPRWLSALIFFGTFLLVWGGVHFYLYSRVSAGFDLGSRARLILKVSLIVLALLYLAGKMLERFAGQSVGVPVMWVGALWMGILSITLSTLIVFDVWVALPAWVLQRTAAIRPSTAGAVLKWGMVAVLSGSALLTAWGVKNGLSGPRVTELEQRMRGLPASAKNFSIVVASDIHIGDLTTQPYLDRLITQIESLQPDLVVLIGDLTDESNGGDGTAFRKLASIRAKYGVIAATGNHEWYSGGDKVVAALSHAGIPVLQQKHQVIAGAFVVAGVDDPAFLGGRRGAAAAIDRAVAGRPEGLPVVLLSHQPVAVEHAAQSGVSLMLCGHTHGGQIPPFQLITGLAFPFFKGSYQVGEMRVYVNNGAGSWGPPIRLFADPEIVRIRLTPA